MGIECLIYIQQGKQIIEPGEMSAMVSNTVQRIMSGKYDLFIPVSADGILYLDKKICFIHNACITFLIFVKPPVRINDNKYNIVCQMNLFRTRAALFGRNTFLLSKYLQYTFSGSSHIPILPFSVCPIMISWDKYDLPFKLFQDLHWAIRLFCATSQDGVSNRVIHLDEHCLQETQLHCFLRHRLKWDSIIFMRTSSSKAAWNHL